NDEADPLHQRRPVVRAIQRPSARGDLEQVSQRDDRHGTPHRPGAAQRRRAAADAAGDAAALIAPAFYDRLNLLKPRDDCPWAFLMTTVYLVRPVNGPALDAFG